MGRHLSVKTFGSTMQETDQVVTHGIGQLHKTSVEALATR
jgi:hypothetical protein